MVARLELAKLMRDRNFDPQVAGDEIMRVYQLSSDKINSVLSLFSRISDNLKKSKKSVDHVLAIGGTLKFLGLQQ